MKLKLFIIFFIALINIAAQANDYYQNLYYTCRVWGFLKYYHSEVAKGNINWDEKLFETLDSLKSISTNEEFNQVLLELVESAGEMADPKSDQPIDFPKELTFNYNFDWCENEIFSDEVKSKLLHIQDNFRAQENFYVFQNYSTPIFDNDDQFFTLDQRANPEEKYRLLALFRYWNIIRYFNPYNEILDQDWDATLVQFIPKFINADTIIDYNKAVLELQAYLNDTHGYTSSPVIIESIEGYYYLPLELGYLDNKTVILRVFEEDAKVKPGDIVVSINNIDISHIRDSLRVYIAASNETQMNFQINKRIIKYPQKITVPITVENDSGVTKTTLDYITSNAYWRSYYLVSHKPWEIISRYNVDYGYIDMSQLKVNSIETMFTDLWDTDAIIIDIRNYPNTTLWDMVPFLFDSPIQNADFTVPDVSRPGIFKWSEETIGEGDFSKTYHKPLILVFNEKTISQAEYTVMSLEQHPKSIKIGSQTAGADGNVTSVKLPAGIRVYFTSLGTFYPDRRPTQRIGIIPDIEVHPTIEGIREGRDEVLEVALQQNATSVDGEKNQIYSYNLTQNFPNPFNPTTTLTYELGERSFTKIKVYDIIGREVTTLVDEIQLPGIYKINFDGSGLSSGIYFYKLITENYVQTRKMLLLK